MSHFTVLAGYFKLKLVTAGKDGEFSLVSDKRCKSGYADSALKGNIDFAGMRDEAGEKAGKQWGKIHAIIGAYIEGFKKWEGARSAHENISRARATYHTQPLMVALREAKEFMAIRKSVWRPTYQ